MDNKKIIGALVAIAVVAAAVFAAGCVEPTEEVEQVTVMMSYTPVADFAPFYCALNQGYYADEGIDVTIQHSSEGSMGPIKQVGANNIKFGFAAGSSLITARTKGVPIITIYQIEQTNPYLIIAKKESEITKPEDLIGKSIAIPGSGCPQQIETEAMLLKSGLDYNKVNFVPTGGQEIAALLQNKTDAMAGHIFHICLLKSMGEGRDINVLYGRDYANMVGCGLITNEKTLNENPELVRKFVRATDKGFKFAIDNPEKAVDIYIKDWAPQYAEKKDFNLDYWRTCIDEIYQPDKYALGVSNGTQWTMTQDVLYDLGLIDHKIDLCKAYTNEFVPSAS